MKLTIDISDEAYMAMRDLRALAGCVTLEELMAKACGTLQCALVSRHALVVKTADGDLNFMETVDRSFWPSVYGHAPHKKSEGVKAMIETMQKHEGLYVAIEPMRPAEFVPLIALGGKIYATQRDQELRPNGFSPTVIIKGPLR